MQNQKPVTRRERSANLMASIDFPIILSIVSLVLLGVAALGFGADSRPGFTEDRVR